MDEEKKRQKEKKKNWKARGLILMSLTRTNAKNSPIYFREKYYGCWMGTRNDGFDGVWAQLF